MHVEPLILSAERNYLLSWKYLVFFCLGLLVAVNFKFLEDVVSQKLSLDLQKLARFCCATKNSCFSINKLLLFPSSTQLIFTFEVCYYNAAYYFYLNWKEAEIMVSC